MSPKPQVYLAVFYCAYKVQKKCYNGVMHVTTRHIQVNSHGYSLSFVIIEEDIRSFKRWLKGRLKKHGYEKASIKIESVSIHFRMPCDVWTRDSIDEQLKSICDNRTEVFLG